MRGQSFPIASIVTSEILELETKWTGDLGMGKPEAVLGECYKASHIGLVLYAPFLTGPLCGQHSEG